MTQVSIAAAAADFSAHHPVAVVLNVMDMVWVECFEEARPAGAGLELSDGVKQRQPAKATNVNAFRFVMQQRPAERSFGGTLEQDAAFVRTQVPGKSLALERIDGVEIKT